MAYFKFYDDFHLKEYAELRNFLKPYKIKKINLPYLNSSTFSCLSHSPIVNLHVPTALLQKYSSLTNKIINISTYYSEQELLPKLYKKLHFNVIIVSREDYHRYKKFAKNSPHCAILVDTSKDLQEDELLFYRMPNYSLYYGPDGPAYLNSIIGSQSTP
jgi:hypothetical protein